MQERYPPIEPARREFKDDAPRLNHVRLRARLARRAFRWVIARPQYNLALKTETELYELGTPRGASDHDPRDAQSQIFWTPISAPYFTRVLSRVEEDLTQHHTTEIGNPTLRRLLTALSSDADLHRRCHGDGIPIRLEAAMAAVTSRLEDTRSRGLFGRRAYTVEDLASARRQLRDAFRNAYLSAKSE